MVGFGAPRRTGRLPPFVLVALLVVIALLAFNYWSVSARQAALQDDIVALQEQVQRTEVARSRLEKRHSELMVQAESNRRQLEQRLGEYQNVGDRLQARDLEAQRCEADREREAAVRALRRTQKGSAVLNVTVYEEDRSRLGEIDHSAVSSYK